jgi:hypothetical protein
MNWMILNELAFIVELYYLRVGGFWEGYGGSFDEYLLMRGDNENNYVDYQ